MTKQGAGSKSYNGSSHNETENTSGGGGGGAGLSMMSTTSTTTGVGPGAAGKSSSGSGGGVAPDSASNTYQRTPGQILSLTSNIDFSMDTESPEYRRRSNYIGRFFDLY